MSAHQKAVGNLKRKIGNFGIPGPNSGDSTVHSGAGNRGLLFCLRGVRGKAQVLSLEG